MRKDPERGVGEVQHEDGHVSQDLLSGLVGQDGLDILPLWVAHAELGQNFEESDLPTREKVTAPESHRGTKASVRGRTRCSRVKLPQRGAVRAASPNAATDVSCRRSLGLCPQALSCRRDELPA